MIDAPGSTVPELLTEPELSAGPELLLRASLIDHLHHEAHATDPGHSCPRCPAWLRAHRLHPAGNRRPQRVDPATTTR